MCYNNKYKSMENYMKFEKIGQGGGGNCVYLVKNLSDNKVKMIFNTYRDMQ